MHLIIFIIIGLGSSFIGSFVSLWVWLHWHFEDHLEYYRVRRAVRRGQKYENKERRKKGLQPL